MELFNLWKYIFWQNISFIQLQKWWIYVPNMAHVNFIIIVTYYCITFIWGMVEAFIFRVMVLLKSKCRKNILSCNTESLGSGVSLICCWMKYSWCSLWCKNQSKPKKKSLTCIPCILLYQRYLRYYFTKINRLEIPLNCDDIICEQALLT